MGIEEICKTIQNVINTYTRKPFTAISGLIMVCSLAQRPGLSCMVSTANIINAIACHDIKTDDMEDGQPNKLNAFIKEVVCEVFRAMKEDANVQVSFGPGSITSVGTGGNAGGPVVVTSNIVNYAKGVAVVN